MDPYKQYAEELKRGDTVLYHPTRKDKSGSPKHIVRKDALQVEIAEGQGFVKLAAPPVESVDKAPAKKAKKTTTAKVAETAKAVDPKAKPAAKTVAKKTDK